MRLLRAAALGLLLHTAALAQTLPSTQDQAAIRTLIQRQIDDFRRDDADAAFAAATPALQQQFGTAARFMDMVRRAYQPVYRPRDVDFQPLELRDGQVTQPVELVGPDGAAARAIYTLEPDGAGGWRISGCYLERSARVGT